MPKTMEGLASKVMEMVPKKRGRPVSADNLRKKKEKLLLDLEAKFIEGLEQFGVLLPLALATLKDQLTHKEWEAARWLLEKSYGKPTEKIVEGSATDSNPTLDILNDLKKLRERELARETSEQERVGSHTGEVEPGSNPSDVGTLLRQELTKASDGG